MPVRTPSQVRTNDRNDRSDTPRRGHRPLASEVPARDAHMNQPKLSPETLDALQRQTFDYFVYEVNPLNGLVADSTQEGAPASIAAVGLALTAYPVGVERALITRAKAVERTLATLRFFRNSAQDKGVEATGYKGFYYHFLDMKTGRRVWNSELSTVDTAFLLAGMLTAAAYFTNDTKDEREIHTLANELYRRADWQWALDGEATVTHGWKPESGFLPYRWQGYDEALLLYLLGLGSPTHPLSERHLTKVAALEESAVNKREAPL